MGRCRAGKRPGNKIFLYEAIVVSIPGIPELDKWRMINMAAYKALGNEDEMMDIGGFASRPIMNLEVDGDPVRVVLKGLALVDAESKDGDMFESLRMVVMMPKDFADHEQYAEEMAMSFTGKALIPAAIKHFGDAEEYAKSGEVWLNPTWLNKECDIQIVTLARDGDADKGYSPLKVLRASTEPRKTKRTDLTPTMSPASAYQQPGAGEGSTEVGGQYQM